MESTLLAWLAWWVMLVHSWVEMLGFKETPTKKSSWELNKEQRNYPGWVEWCIMDVYPRNKATTWKGPCCLFCGVSFLFKTNTCKSSEKNKKNMSSSVCVWALTPKNRCGFWQIWKITCVSLLGQFDKDYVFHLSPFCCLPTSTRKKGHRCHSLWREENKSEFKVITVHGSSLCINQYDVW